MIVTHFHYDNFMNFSKDLGWSECGLSVMEPVLETSSVHVMHNHISSEWLLFSSSTTYLWIHNAYTRE